MSTATEKLKSNQRGVEEDLKHRLEQEKDLLLLDQDQDRGAYQKLLKEYHELEQHAEMLEQKLAMHAPAHSRSLSNASSSSGQIVSTELPQDDQNIVKLFLLHIYRDLFYFHMLRSNIVLFFKGFGLRISKVDCFFFGSLFTIGNDRLESTKIG